MPKKKKDDETITIFGEEIEEDAGFDSDNVIWGFLLIIGGAILLLNTLGLVPWQVWNTIWHFWPVLIILLGFQILSGKGFFGNIIITIVTVLFLITVALFALSVTNPELVNFLPEAIDPIFDYMKGVVR